MGEETAGKEGFVLIIALNRPYSRGTVTLASTDPFEQAIIDVNYLSDPRDVDNLVGGIIINIFPLTVMNIFCSDHAFNG